MTTTPIRKSGHAPTAAALETAWPAIERALASGERIGVGALLENQVGLPWSSPDYKAALEALESRLREDGRFAQSGRGHWCLQNQAPIPPQALRMPTVRIATSTADRAAAELEDTIVTVMAQRRETAIKGFTVVLRYSHIALGALRPTVRHVGLFPSAGPTALSLVLPTGQEHTVWWQHKPQPLLYGLEYILAAYDPGQHLRFVRLSEGRFALTELPSFNQKVYESESRLFNLSTLAALRQYGLSYRHELGRFLAGHPQGIRVGPLLEGLGEKFGFAPNPSTIRGILSAAPEFVNTQGVWRYHPELATDWSPGIEAALQTLEREGEAYLLHAPYRAVLAPLGTSTEPLTYVLTHARPEYLYVVATPESKDLLPGILRGLKHKPRHRLVVCDEKEDLLTMTRVVNLGLHHLIQAGYAPSSILVDYTTGTKAMVAGAVLATFQAGCALAYVGGTRRDETQRGLVVTGNEALRVVPAWGGRGDRLTALLS